MCEKYCRDRQATDNNKIRRIGVTFRITKATKTQSDYVILKFVYGKRNCTFTPQCHVLRALAVFGYFEFFVLNIMLF
jgi:hypothetical protein